MVNSVLGDWPQNKLNWGWAEEPSSSSIPSRIEGWPAGTQRVSNNAERLLSQAVAWWDASQYRDGERFLKNRGTSGEVLNLRLGSSNIENSNDPKFVSPENNGYVYNTAGTFNYLQVPNEQSFNITGDIDIRMKLSPVSWTNNFATYLSKRDFSENQWSWVLLGDNTKKIRFTTSNNGSTHTLSLISTESVPFEDGQEGWIRVTLDVDNESGGNTAVFYTSVDGINWIQLGNQIINSGTTSIFSGTAPVRAMYFLGNSASTEGKVYSFQLWNRIEGFGGVKVLDVDCDVIASGSATSFTALTGQTVSIIRSASGRKSVVVPSISKNGRPLFLFGTDDYMEIQDNWQHNLLNFNQGQSFTLIGVWRQWNVATGATNLVINKSWTSSQVGWQLWTWNGSSTVLGTTRDDNGQVDTPGPSFLSGIINTAVFVGKRDPDGGVVYLNNIPGNSRSLPTRSLSNTLPVRIGADPNPFTYSDMEFYAAAVFRRSLSLDEIKTISNYYLERIA